MFHYRYLTTSQYYQILRAYITGNNYTILLYFREEENQKSHKTYNKRCIFIKNEALTQEEAPN